jgi:hypothetical protein
MIKKYGINNSHLKMSIRNPSSNKPKRISKARQDLESQYQQQQTNGVNQSSEASKKAPAVKLEDIPRCPSCTQRVHELDENTGEIVAFSSEYCMHCGYYFQDEKNVPTLTLAQKRGLVAIPKSQQYETIKSLEWYVIEKTIEKKKEPDAFCPICMAAFLTNDEILLSCGHLFHKVCLRSFENFMKNTDLSCPLCR